MLAAGFLSFPLRAGWSARLRGADALARVAEGVQSPVGTRSDVSGARERNVGGEKDVADSVPPLPDRIVTSATPPPAGARC